MMISTVNSLVRAFSEGSDRQEKNVWILPQLLLQNVLHKNPVCTFGSHGPYSGWHSKHFKRVSEEHLARAHFPAKASSASRGSQRIPCQSELSTSKPVSSQRLLCFFSFTLEVSSLVVPYGLILIARNGSKGHTLKEVQTEVRSELLVCSLLRCNNQTSIDRAHNLLSRAQAIYSILHKATLDLT